MVLMQVRTSQPSFSSGEISPLLHGRPDYLRYQTGVETMTGFLPLREGGFTRAPGTIYRGTTAENAAARLIPFRFAENDALVLEFTPMKMRVWRYGELILDGGGQPYVLATPFDADDLANIDYAQSADVIYLVDGRNPLQKLSRFALDHWELTAAVNKNGPFEVQNLDEELTLQVADEMAVIKQWEPSQPIAQGESRRYGNHLYVCLSVGNTSTGPNPPTHLQGSEAYLVKADNSEEGTDEYISWFYAKTLDTEGFVTVVANHDMFELSDVGQVFLVRPTDYTSVPLWTGNTTFSFGNLVRNGKNTYRLLSNPDEAFPYAAGTRDVGVNPPIHTEGVHLYQKNPDVWWEFVSDDLGIFKVVSLASAREITAEVIKKIPQSCADAPTYRWARGAWSDEKGWPAAIELHQNRLWAAATAAQPRGLWASVVGDFLDFEPGGEVDDAIATAIDGSDSQNGIRWLARARKGLYVGALGEVIRAYSTNSNQVITAETLDTDLEGMEGVARARPIVPLTFPIYIPLGGRGLYEQRYSYEEDGGRPLDIAEPSDHIAEAGFEQVVFQRGRLRLIWLRRSSGDLAACIYNPEEQTLGWSTVPVAGGVVEDMAVVPALDGTDTMLMVVRRTLGGVEQRCIEEIAPPFAKLLGQVDGSAAIHFYCSAVVEFEGAQSSLSVPHLAGETVGVWTEFGNMGPLTVAGDGALDLPYPVMRAVVGLFDETHRVRTLPLRTSARDGDATGRQQRLHTESAIRIHQTSGGTVAAGEKMFGHDDILRAAQQIVPRAAAGEDAAAWSGLVDLEVATGLARETFLEFRPQGGAPMTVQYLVTPVEQGGA